MLFFFGCLLSLNIFAENLAENVSEAQRGAGSQAYKDEIQKNQKLFNTCYKNAYKKPLKNETAVVVEWQVDDTGAVRTAKIRRSTLGNIAVEECIIAKIKQIEFPLAKEGQLMNIVYTLFFNDRTLAEK